jgi:CarD family transcriptional regulator
VADAQISLNAGDRVVYPNQGVCRVTGIEDKEVAGQKLTFVSLRREEDGALVMVPRTKLATIGVRKVSTAEDVAAIFTFLQADPDKTDLDWKQRARANLDRMSQGGIRGLAEVVKGLQVLSELRPLPNKERELYDTARHLLVTEISASIGMAEVDAEDAVDLALFPPGRERPRRTVAELTGVPEEGEGLEGAEEGFGEEGELGLPDELEVPAEPESVISDEEVTQPMGSAEIPDEALPPKRRRGRPPKVRPLVAAVPSPAPPAAPKKRGRPPKPKPVVEVPPAPKKRGRPPKATPAAKPSAKPASAKGAKPKKK